MITHVADYSKTAEGCFKLSFFPFSPLEGSRQTVLVATHPVYGRPFFYVGSKDPPHYMVPKDPLDEGPQTPPRNLCCGTGTYFRVWQNARAKKINSRLSVTKWR